MSTVYHFDDIFFDSIFNFDDDEHFDSNANTNLIIESEIFGYDQYRATEYDEFIIECLVEIDEAGSKYIDLLRLVPEKFRSSLYLQDFLKIAGIYAGSWMGKVDEIAELIDPNKVTSGFAQHLASLVGLTLITGDEITDEEIRKQLKNNIDTIKLKGTYTGFSVAAYSLGLTINISDLYTNDYATFIEEPWFVGERNENPPGLDNSYYKSPHFGIQVVLNKEYNVNSMNYLWKESLRTNWYRQIEMNRPINTVPHYSILLNPVCDESGTVMTVAGNIKTRVTEDWQTTRLFFDMSYITSAYGDFNFDDGEHFDQSVTSFISQITNWKIGIGNKGVSPDESGFALQYVTLTGSITTVNVCSDRICFGFTIPKSYVQNGISELGLFFADNTTMVLASTFPDIDKNNTEELEILVEVYTR